MSAQLVDAYLDELLAPLAEDARIRTAIQAEIHSQTHAPSDADCTRDAAAACVEAVVCAAPTVAPVPVTTRAPLPQPPPARPLTPTVTFSPRPEPASPVYPMPPTPVPQTAPPAMPRHVAKLAPPASATLHGGAPARASQGSAGNRWLRAALGRDRYAFELLRVQEVVRMSPIIALRGTSTALLGVMNLRGRVVPIFDLARWLGTGSVDPDEHARIIVVERGDELIGALVSSVEDVVTLTREHIEPPLPGTDPGGMLGIARIGRLPTVLLDADALFD